MTIDPKTTSSGPSGWTGRAGIRIAAPLLGAVMLFSLLLQQSMGALAHTPRISVGMSLLLFALLCGGLAGLFSGGPRRGGLWLEAGLSALLAGLLALAALGVLAANGQLGLLEQRTVPLLLLSLSAPAFLCGRIFLYLEAWWAVLRRRQIAWSLAHAMLSAASLTGLVFLLGTLGGLAYLVVRDAGSLSALPPGPENPLFVRVVFWVLGLALFVLSFLAVGLLLVLPPVLFFSHRTTSGITRRLDALAGAVERASAGETGVRLPVEGEDELARLQAGFNALATRLEEGSTRATERLHHERERLVREVRAERDRANRLLHAHRTLAVEVSDELRAPLATAAAALETVVAQWQEGYPSPALQEAVTQASVEIKRLRRFTDDLVTLSRVEAERLDLTVKPVAVAPLLNRLVEEAAPAAWETRRVRLTCTAAGDLPLAMADEERLEQVMGDLIRSSLRRTLPGGEVRVTAGSADERLRICVEDSGAGIPVTAMPRVWERGASPALGQRASPALGFGLALVRELAEAMGGSVGVDPLPGEGNLFWVELQVASRED